MKKLTALLIATLMLLTLFTGCNFLNKNPDTITDIPEDIPTATEDLEEDTDLTDIQAAADKKADEIKASILDSVDETMSTFTKELHITPDETYTNKLTELRDRLADKTKVECTDLKFDESVDKTKATVKITVSMPDLESFFSDENFTALLAEARANAQSEGDLTPYISIIDTLIEEINSAKLRSVSATGILKKNADGWETTEIIEE